MFSIFNFKSDKKESLCENNELQEALENNYVTEVDPDDLSIFFMFLQLQVLSNKIKICLINIQKVNGGLIIIKL